MLHDYREAFIRLFYPAQCACCNGMLTLQENLLCTDCAQDLSSLAGSFEEALVDEKFEHLDHVWTVFTYESPLKEILHKVKYARKDYLLRACTKPAISLAQAVTSDYWYDAVLPIPIDRFKFVKRHFNQAESLLDLLRPWITPPAKTALLAKRYPIPSQASLSQQERAINIYGAFKVRHPSKIAGRSFLLIDDVFTTGATANEASRILKVHGARRVDLFALARTISPFAKNSLRFHSYADKMVAS